MAASGLTEVCCMITSDLANELSATSTSFRGYASGGYNEQLGAAISGLVVWGLFNLLPTLVRYARTCGASGPAWPGRSPLRGLECHPDFPDQAFSGQTYHPREAWRPPGLPCSSGTPVRPNRLNLRVQAKPPKPPKPAHQIFA